MVTKQLSIFLENKSGRLTEVTEVLGKANINLSALCIAENADFGILRCIVSDPDKAYKTLKENHFAVKFTDVVGINCPNTPGALSKVLEYLSDEGIFIEYMYSFANGDSANIIIRPSDLEGAIKVLSEKKVDLLASSDLYKL
jgi:hypothetical protein